jgi:hypothetical protein
VPDVVGATPHVEFTVVGWQILVVAGALAMIAAGLIAVTRPARLAVMSSKYEAPAGPAPARPRAAGEGAAGREAAGPPADSASIWEALSRGDDPTASSRQAAGA